MDIYHSINQNAPEQIRKDLFAMQDMEYHNFHCKLIPTVDSDLVIGVRTPELRNYAQKIAKTSLADDFVKILPHKYYEENNLHGFLIEGIKDYDTLIQELEFFLPYIDNWATCDMISPKIFKKHLPELFIKIKEWLMSKHTYTIRFGIGMLLKYYLDDAFSEEYLELVATVKSEEYYVKMMVAWYFATALAKQYDATLPYIESCKLESWTHNKAIQKAIESYRITSEQKIYLKSLKQNRKY